MPMISVSYPTTRAYSDKTDAAITKAAGREPARKALLHPSVNGEVTVAVLTKFEYANDAERTKLEKALAKFGEVRDLG